MPAHTIFGYFGANLSCCFIEFDTKPDETRWLIVHEDMVYSRENEANERLDDEPRIVVERPRITGKQGAIKAGPDLNKIYGGDNQELLHTWCDDDVAEYMFAEPFDLKLKRIRSTAHRQANKQTAARVTQAMDVVNRPESQSLAPTSAGSGSTHSLSDVMQQSAKGDAVRNEPHNFVVDHTGLCKLNVCGDLGKKPSVGTEKVLQANPGRAWPR